jgi:hypothetical protein
MCWDRNSGSGESGVKTGRRRCFWVLWRGELERTNVGSGVGVHSLVHPYFDGFQSLGVGVYLHLEDMSSPRSETEWIKCP